MKTSKLTGAALDWAVSKCEGVDVTRLYAWDYSRNNYSTDWSQGGPIIEREGVDLFRQASTGEWCGSLPRGHKVGWRFLQYGPTPLIAAMRCYVASKLGDEVEIPKELTE